MKTDRYTGKPLVRLLECYVLKAIGHLAAEDEARLSAMEPQLRKVYRHNGSWVHIISSAMEFPNNMPETIEQMWRRNQDIARASGVDLGAQQFAEMFVDQNFAS
jgi:hypothetical protein